MNIDTQETSAEQQPRLAGLGDHDGLLADLTEALEPGAAPAVLGVFELAGFADYGRRYGELAALELLARCAERFVTAIRPGTCYHARKDEFCALINRPLEKAIVELSGAELAINVEAYPFVSAQFAATVLPDEAADSTELLILADERLSVVRGIHKPRERRQSIRPSD